MPKEVGGVGAAVGLLLGLGLLALWSAFQGDRRTTPGRPRRGLLLGGGLRSIGSEVLLALVGLCVAVALSVQVAVASPAVALAAGAVCAAACHGWLVHRGVRRVRALADAWPGVLDQVASSLSAGLSPQEALTRLERRAFADGGQELTRLVRDVRASGRAADAVPRWAAGLRDPVSHRAAFALTVAVEQGGASDCLRTVARHLREDVRLRRQAESRRRPVAVAAKLALLVPAGFVALTALRGDGWAEFDGIGGGAVLLGSVLLGAVGHRLVAAWQLAPLARWGLA